MYIYILKKKKNKKVFFNSFINYLYCCCSCGSSFFRKNQSEWLKNFKSAEKNTKERGRKCKKTGKFY